MENKASIEQFLDSINNKIVYQSKSSIILNALFIVAGIILIAISGKITEDPHSLIPMLLIVIGIILILWGCIAIVFKKKSYKLIGNNKKISLSELFFDIKERDKLLRIIGEGNMKELTNLKPATIDTLKLCIATTDDGSFCCSQVVTYASLEFNNVNDVHEHSPEEAAIILNVLKKRNKS